VAIVVSWMCQLTLQSRVRHLITELQICLAHANPDVAAEEHLDGSDNQTDYGLQLTDQSPKENGDALGSLLCPHKECEGKLKTRFRKWKNFVRHYTIRIPPLQVALGRQALTKPRLADVECNDECVFCGCKISRVRQYFTHYDSCKVRKYQEHTSPHKRNSAIRRRRTLNEMASRELGLKLSINAPEKQGVSNNQRGRHVEHIARKRPSETTDTSSATFRRSRKRQNITNNYTGFNTSTSSALAYPLGFDHDVENSIGSHFIFKLFSARILTLLQSRRPLCFTDPFLPFQRKARCTVT